ncbi:putative ring finger [Phaeomoniella chlamydospora]|uniref:Putative ring finger n=1 Tax=Phaeomoniella chlamydospora TaxID=158046 RepID=A0A0G2GB32_PHACM|nr:putative ring finger [Phaeomoniella chlamydospora]
MMYRGPGYEEFPVALNTSPVFVEAYDEWDRKQTVLRRRHSAISPSTKQNGHDRLDSGSSTLQPAESHLTPFGMTVPETENACLAQAIQIFPNIEHDFVRRKCRDYLAQLDPDLIALDLDPSAEVIAQIAELDQYPEHNNKRKRTSHLGSGTTGYIDWGQNATDAKTQAYVYDGVKLLAQEFQHIPTHVIDSKLRETSKVFDTYRFLEACERTYHSMHQKPYRRLRLPRQSLESKYELKRPPIYRPEKEYMYLVNELQAAKKACHDDRRQAKRQKDEEEIEATNFKAHFEAGLLIECQCCFDDEVPINRAVPCDGDDIHFYCHSCIKNQAASQIGQIKWRMSCMYSGAKACDASLSRSALQMVLDSKSLAKLEEIQRNHEIGLAAIDDLEDCPFCEFKAICVSVEIDREFRCRNPDCSKISCRLCHGLTHIPKSCDEAKKDRGTELRHDVEEAMSDALIRKCPNSQCKMPIIKEYGCNKMICTNCRNIMCYVCGKGITHEPGGGYNHFHRQGSTCRLHDDQPATDARQIQEAERAAIRRLKENNPDVDENALKVPAGPQVNTNGQFQPLHPVDLDFDLPEVPPPRAITQIMRAGHARRRHHERIREHPRFHQWREAHLAAMEEMNRLQDLLERDLELPQQALGNGEAQGQEIPAAANGGNGEQVAPLGPMRDAQRPVAVPAPGAHPYRMINLPPVFEMEAGAALNPIPLVVNPVNYQALPRADVAAPEMDPLNLHVAGPPIFNDQYWDLFNADFDAADVNENTNEHLPDFGQVMGAGDWIGRNDGGMNNDDAWI